MSSTLRMRARARSPVALAMLLACCVCAFALDPKLDISQYAHTSWKIRDGFTKSRITSIAQTPDGYLWLGTEFGLVRFDGVRAVPWHPPAGQQLPNDWIYSLEVARDGTLWIGTMSGLASLKDGKLVQYPETAGNAIFSVVEDHEGTVWATTSVPGSTSSKICAARGGRVECYGEELFKQGIERLYEDNKGNLWASGMAGLWRWKPGPPQRYEIPHAVTSGISDIDGPNGELLIALHEGLRRLVGSKTQDFVIPGANFQFTPQRLFRSSDGSLWIGTAERGLIHMHQGTADWFAQTDGLSGNAVFALFEDREGNVWAGTSAGLDRFRDFAVPTISSNQGLPNAYGWSVLAAKDGSVWVGSTSGVGRWREGRVTIYTRPQPVGQRPATPTPYSSAKSAQVVTNSGVLDRVESLFEDHFGQIWATGAQGIVRWGGTRFLPVPGVPGPEVYAMAEDLEGTVWLSSRDQGLLRVSREGDVERTPWSHLAGGDNAPAMAVDSSQGGLWLGFVRSGVVYWKDGQVRAAFTSANGLGQGRVSQLRFGTRGTLWAATQGGLSRIKDGRVATLTSKNGLPCDSVHWSVEDGDHFVWLYMPCGLVRISRSELDTWVTNPKHTLQTAVYDVSDGVRLTPRLGGWGPHVSKSPDGRIWFPNADGVSVIDPHHLPFNKIPPPVHIEEITADRKTYDVTPGSNEKVHLPPRIRDLQIDYAALSLVAPEKVLFRYKLEGFDQDWQDAGNRRQAFYTNLPPRNYTFRVKASNNSGVWNEAGTLLDFSVAPAYYQTIWFRSLCVIAFLALLAAFYQWRLRQVARMFNMRMEERVNERTRVARDLHDTLLQSFQGVLLKFHAVTYLLPDRPDEAQKNLEAVIEQARQAVTEGRDTVYGLRSSTVVTNELAPALSTLGAELAANPTDGNRVDFRVHVEGTPRNLSPIVRDEVYRIAVEALRNAFRHACAGRIELEIRYDRRQFRLRVRDDGKGIDPKVLSGDGRPGHYGLPGMHERARQVGGKLAVWSERGSGTEAELTIPASVAYKKSPAARRPMFFRRGA